MSAEEGHQATTSKRINDEHVSGGRVSFHRNAFHAPFEFSECIRQAQRIARDGGPSGISTKFTTPGDGHLNQQRSKWRNDDHRQRDNGMTSLPIVATSSPEDHSPPHLVAQNAFRNSYGSMFLVPACGKGVRGFLRNQIKFG